MQNLNDGVQSKSGESNGVRGKRGQCYHYCRDNVPTERCVF